LETKLLKKNQTKLKINLNKIENTIHQMKLKIKLKPKSNEIEHKIQMELEMKFKQNWKQNSNEIIKHKIQAELKMKFGYIRGFSPKVETSFMVVGHLNS
jgi:hypothetical protein